MVREARERESEREGRRWSALGQLCSQSRRAEERKRGVIRTLMEGKGRVGATYRHCIEPNPNPNAQGEGETNGT
jgi:hypothetical protein